VVTTSFNRPAVADVALPIRRQRVDATVDISVRASRSAVVRSARRFWTGDDCPVS
jgi:hypothetical protein